MEAEQIVDVLEDRDDLRADDVRAVATLIRGSVSPCDRLIDAMHPWTSYVVVPLFALANAGIELTGERLHRPVDRASSASPSGSSSASCSGSRRSAGSPCSSGSAASRTAPAGATSSAVGAVAGIGFTVSLFITGLAFESPTLQDDAKIGTLAASLVAALLGAAALVVASRRAR